MDNSANRPSLIDLYASSWRKAMRKEEREKRRRDTRSYAVRLGILVAVGAVLIGVQWAILCMVLKT